jgi:hypothetical protein
MTSNITTFYSDPNPLEILRITKEGVWANPDIPVDEAAKKVLEAIDHNIKVLVQKAVEDEREGCAKWADLVAREMDNTNNTATYIASGIRARGEK